MDKPLRVRWCRIIVWITAFTFFAFGLWFLDIAWLQKKPLIWISNYSDVVLTIWETQTTISSLTLASAAFILGKIDDSFYGISIKNLLHLSRHFPKIELSFWEKLICSIVLPVITWLFVILDNITSASFLLLFTVYRSYNFTFFNRFSYRRISQHISEKIQALNSLIQNAGQWDTGYSDVAIYVDSTLATVGFFFPTEDFMTVTEELTDSELKYVCQNYKTADGFVFKESSNSVEIPFKEEELIEYLRIAMVKIRYSIPAILPRQKNGFITYYVE